MCASMKTHGRSPTFSWIRSSLNPTTESLLRLGSHFISRAHALGNPPDVTPVVAVGHVTVGDSGSPSYSEMKPHSMHWRSGPTISGLPWPYSSTASTRVSHTRLWAVGPGRGRRMRPLDRGGSCRTNPLSRKWRKKIRWGKLQLRSLAPTLSLVA